MNFRNVLIAFITLLLVNQAQAQSNLAGTNTGAIPDGAGTGPNNFGAPRDIRFLTTSVGTVQDVKVVFQANHTFIGDLRATLISPQGIEHLLFDRTGATTATATGSAANLISTHAGYGFRDNSLNNWWTLADIGNVDIPVSNARSVLAGPTTSPAAVTSINAAFLDKPVAGVWTLRFEDGWSGDTGAVTGATLEITRFVTQLAVTKVADTNDGVCDADCSLREAIAAASTTLGQQIVFAAPFFDAPRTIFLNSELLINKNLAISGPGAHRLTISAANRSRVFRVTGARVTLAGMRISDGVGADAGGVSAQGGDLLLHRVEVSNCRATGVGAFGAGGLFQSAGGLLTMSESSITGNYGQGDSVAGGLALRSSTRIIRSTISGNLLVSNTFNTSGGLFAESALTLIDSTVTANVVRGSGTDQSGGVLAAGGVLSVMNSAVAANLGGAADLLAFGLLNSGGYNAIGRIGDLSSSFNKPGDQFGTTATPLDPIFSPLSYHGGTVPVHVPLLASPLLDTGRSFRQADVRGVALVDLAIAPAAGGNDADIGAVELSPILVENLSFNDTGSLRQALLNAPAAPAVTDILFDPALFAVPATLRFGTQISIDRNVSIHGPGAQRLSLDGARQARVLTVLANRLVSVSGLTLADGNGNSRDNTPPNPGAGGVILNSAGSHLSIINSVISGGRDATGSAINNLGALLLRGSTITGNAGPSTGSPVLRAVQNSTTLIELSTISNNRGNALGLEQASASVLRSTLHANAGASAIDAFVSPTFVFGSIVAGQRSGNDFSNNSNGLVISGGYNFIGNPGALTAFNQPGDQAGTSGSPFDPRLSPLAIYSGQVPVHMPLANSTSVIDKGLGRIRDQRGLALFDAAFFSSASDGDHSDIGATEAQVQIVDTPGDAGAGTLRQALLNANANGPGVDDVLMVGFGRIDLTGALPTLTGNTNLIGPGASNLRITRAVGAPDFSLIASQGPVAPSAPAQLSISGVTLDNGRGSGEGDGGGVDANLTELHLSAVEVINNVGTAASAGGVSIVQADGVIQNSTFANNSGADGGAVFFEGRNHRLRVEQSTFSANTADFGAGIRVSANADNGPDAQARLELFSSTLANNTANFGGAVGATSRNGAANAIATVTLKNTLLSSNGLSANAVLFAPNLVAQGFNLSTIALPQLNQVTDLSPANGLLGPLANNGGPVRTHDLNASNAGLDAGFSTNALFDARGLARQLDLAAITNSDFTDTTDIGAVEVQSLPLSEIIFKNGFE